VKVKSARHNRRPRPAADAPRRRASEAIVSPGEVMILPPRAAKGGVVKKSVSLICLTLALLLCGGAEAGAQGATKCFSADWLQGRRVVKLSVDGGKVAGTFTVEGDGAARGAATYEFKGDLRGNTLHVAFAGGRLPDVSPSEMTSLAWTLARDGGREVLRIKFRGKNYETGRYADSLAVFEPCDGGGGDYDSLARRARTVRFAKGADSASLGLASLGEFQAMREPAAFLIGAARSQSLEITAEGCVIQVYLPNGKPYEFVEWEGEGEKTYAGSMPDRAVIDSLPLTGTYLVVLRKPTENVRPEAVTFKATGRRR